MLLRKKGRENTSIASSDSSSDSDTDYVKKIKCNNDQLDIIEREVAKMLEVSDNFSLPDSMSSIIDDTFRCCICLLCHLLSMDVAVIDWWVVKNVLTNCIKGIKKWRKPALFAEEVRD